MPRSLTLLLTPHSRTVSSERWRRAGGHVVYSLQGKGAFTDSDPSPSLGLQTFESPGAATNQAQEPQTTPEAKAEQEGEGQNLLTD